MRMELIKCRKTLKMTHDAVAEKAGISRAYYTNIEAGRKDPSLKVMKRIADAVNSTVDNIFFNYSVPKGNVNSKDKEVG